MSEDTKAVPVPPSRDQIRAAIFAEKVKSQIVTLPNGIEVEVRQPKAGEMLDAIAEQDLKKRMARTLMSSCYIPGTNEKLFELADYDSLMQLPHNGGSYEALLNAANTFVLDTQVQEARKNSDGTTPGS
jgi:hypothetical protein